MVWPSQIPFNSVSMKQHRDWLFHPTDRTTKKKSCLCPTTIKTTHKKNEIITQRMRRRRDSQQLIFFLIIFCVFFFRIHKKTRLPYSSSSFLWATRAGNQHIETNRPHHFYPSLRFSFVPTIPIHQTWVSWGIFHDKSLYHRTERSRFFFSAVCLHMKYILSLCLHPPERELVLCFFFFSSSSNSPHIISTECNILSKNIFRRLLSGWLNVVGWRVYKRFKVRPESY